MLLPYDIGTVHFIGVGGIGMSGIAEALLSQGFSVSGSDLRESANTERLRELGCDICIGHSADNLGEARVVVISSAVGSDNSELLAARERGLAIVKRAEMLAELMRLQWSVTVAGSHGKTTTTSLIGHILAAGGYDPTIINGGIINAYETNVRLGGGSWFVAEADESDGSFLHLPATVAVVTNLDAEHMEHYGSMASLRSAFMNFVRKIPFYGFAVLCGEHADVVSMAESLDDRRVLTYGLREGVSIRAVNVKSTPAGVNFDIEISNSDTDSGVHLLSGFALRMYGEHNLLNSLAAIGVAYELGVDADCIRLALASFAGVNRRFTEVGCVGGVRIIDDYAHHPVEIAATLRGARQALGDEGRILAVVQPHRYSRVASLFSDFCSCFGGADRVLVSEIYAAGELPLPGISGASLAQGIRGAGHSAVDFLASESDLPGIVHEWCDSGDMVVCLGAGTITRWASDLAVSLDNCAAVGDLRAV